MDYLDGFLVFFLTFVGFIAFCVGISMPLVGALDDSPTYNNWKSQCISGGGWVKSPAFANDICVIDGKEVSQYDPNAAPKKP